MDLGCVEIEWIMLAPLEMSTQSSTGCHRGVALRCPRCTVFAALHVYLSRPSLLGTSIFLACILVQHLQDNRERWHILFFFFLEIRETGTGFRLDSDWSVWDGGGVARYLL